MDAFSRLTSIFFAVLAYPMAILAIYNRDIQHINSVWEYNKAGL